MRQRLLKDHFSTFKLTIFDLIIKRRKLINMKKFLYILPALALLSCGGGESSEDQTPENPIDAEIQEFLKDKDWKPERQESGLYIYKEVEGSAEKPNSESYLTLNYEGRLLDGTVFDGTNGSPVTFDFPVSGLIDGWQEGIPQFGKGGKGKLIVPPNLGYGDREVGFIPASSILVFDIELIDFAQEPPMPEDYSEEIEAYIQENKMGEFEKTESGLYMQIKNEGGEKPTLDHFLTLEYKGYLFDGTVFDGTDGEPITFSFPLGQTIEGWREGIPNIGKGGNGVLIIPPHIGYGDRASGDIPANSVLVFEITIHDFSLEAPQ